MSLAIRPRTSGHHDRAHSNVILPIINSCSRSNLSGATQIMFTPSRRFPKKLQTTNWSIRSVNHLNFTQEILGPIDDLSDAYTARYKPSQTFISLKKTDLKLTHDFNLIEEMIVRFSLLSSYARQTILQNTRLCHHDNILSYHISFIDEEILWTVLDPIRAGLTCWSCIKKTQDHADKSWTKTLSADLIVKRLWPQFYVKYWKQWSTCIKITLSISFQWWI